MLSRRLLTKIPASEHRRKFVKTALLVGSCMYVPQDHEISEHQYTGALLILRNPLEMSVADFHRRRTFNDHVGRADEDDFTTDVFRGGGGGKAGRSVASNFVLGSISEKKNCILKLVKKCGIFINLFLGEGGGGGKDCVLISLANIAVSGNTGPQKDFSIFLPAKHAKFFALHQIFC